MEDHNRVFSECVASVSAISKEPVYSWPNKNFASITCCALASRLWSVDNTQFNFYQRGVTDTIRPLEVPKYAGGTISIRIGQCSDVMTTLCDGIPRAVCPLSATTTAIYSYMGNYGAPITTEPIPFPISRPSCYIDPLDCDRFKWEYELSMQKQDSIANEKGQTISYPPFEYLGCELLYFNHIPSDTYNNTSLNGTTIFSLEYILHNDVDLSAIPLSARSVCNKCEPIKFDSNDQDVDMLFWEGDVDDRIVCSNNMSHSMWYTQEYTQEYSTTYKGNTITYPTPYAFFSTYSVYGCGTPRYNVAIPLRSSEILTYAGEYSNIPTDESFLTQYLHPSIGNSGQ